MRLNKKIFFGLFLFLVCFSLKAQEEVSSPSHDDSFPFLEEEWVDISCSELPQAFEEYKNNVQQNHNLSPALTDSINFLKTAQSSKTPPSELDKKIDAVSIARVQLGAADLNRGYEKDRINPSLEQCLSSASNCQSLIQTFKEYDRHVSFSYLSLGGLLLDLENFLDGIKDGIKNGEQGSPEVIEQKIKDLEEASPLILEISQLFSNRADKISSDLNKCL